MTNHLRRLLAGFTLFVAEFTVTLLIGILGVVSFLLLGREVLNQQVTVFDEQATSWVRELLGPHQLGWVRGVTFLASANFIVIAALLLIGGFLLRRRHRWYTLLVPVVAIGSIVLNLTLKNAYQRPRPSMPLVAAEGLSFPSGHAMIAASFYGLLIYLVQTHVRRPSLRWVRRLTIAALLLLILLIGLTRVYLRVHYTSDVLAGIMAGGVWLLIAIPLLKRIENETKKRFKKTLQTTEKQAL
jgi:membrane-associated phospholipid phosphatase